MSFGVTIKGWKRGLRKISLTEAIAAHGRNYGLADAKRQTDLILEGKTVTIIFDSEKGARNFAKKANELNAIAEFNDDIVLV